MDQKRLYSRSGRIMAVIAFAFSGIGIYALAAESLDLLLTKSWIYFWFAYLAWLLFWNPSVRISDSGVVIDNIFASTKVNWSAISRIDTKYSLSLEVSGQTIRAWAAPAPSRYAAFSASRTEAKGLPESSFIGDRMMRPGDLPSSDSGVAALLIRRHWESLRDRGELNEVPLIEKSFFGWRVIALSVLSLAAVFGFIS